MSWPTDDLSTGDLDAATDSPASARTTLKKAVDYLKTIIAARGIANGIASLDGNTKVPYAQIPASDQSAAQTGTNNDTFMTPLRTKEAIEAKAVLDSVSAWEKIVTKTANNSGSLEFSGTNFNATKYDDYKLILRNLRPAQDSKRLHMYPSDDGGSSYTRVKAVDEGGTDTSWGAAPVDLSSGQDMGNSADEHGWSGEVTIYNFHADETALAKITGLQLGASGALRVRDSGAALQRPSVDGPLNYLKFQMSGGNIQSGSITLLGLRK